MVKTLQKLYVFAVSSDAYENCLSSNEKAQLAEDLFEIMNSLNTNSPPTTHTPTSQDTEIKEAQ